MCTRTSRASRCRRRWNTAILSKVKIENMRLQHTEKLLEKQEMAQQQQTERSLRRRSPSVSSASVRATGWLLYSAIWAAIRSSPGGQTMNPSTQNILSAINRTPAETVFVFPNNKNIIMAAEQTIPLTRETVIVIPSKTVPQGVTALLSFDPDGTAEANTEAMTGALGTVETMQITYAARDSDFDGYEIHQGDYLALCGGRAFSARRRSLRCCCSAWPAMWQKMGGVCHPLHRRGYDAGGGAAGTGDIPSRLPGRRGHPGRGGQARSTIS